MVARKVGKENGSEGAGGGRMSGRKGEKEAWDKIRVQEYSPSTSSSIKTLLSLGIYRWASCCLGQRPQTLTML